MTLADRACLALAVAIAGAAIPATGHAQSAEAEVLFRDGRNLIKHGKLAAGCDKLDASERLESSIGTLLNLGDCREKLGKPASAWAAFRKAEGMARRAGGDDKREAEAGRRAAQLEPRLSNLMIQVPSRVDGLVVRKGREPVDPATWNADLPVDPGNYDIVAEAPGYRPWHTTATVGLDTKRQIVVVPALDRIPPPVAAAPVELPAPPRVVESQPAALPPSPPPPGPLVVHTRTWSATRKLSAVLGIAGAGALGTGVYFGMRASDLQDRANQRCPLTVCSDPEGLHLNDQARSYASHANILYIAGGATLATAVVLWLAGAPDETIVVPTAGNHQLGIAMTGSL